MKNLENKKEMMSVAEKTGMIVPKNISDTILNTIKNYELKGQLHLPPNYSASNALKYAWLKIQVLEDKNSKKAIEVCTKESIANALLETVILGLNPLKNQAYYIVYGTSLTMMPSYFGKQMALNRIAGIEKINAQVIFEGDSFKYEIRDDGSIFNIKHEQQFENIDESKIKGAYSTVTYKGEVTGIAQNFKQIQTSWKGAIGKGFDKTKFKVEFCKRTMINLIVKHFLQTTDDTDLLTDTLIKNEHAQYEFEVENVDTDKIETKDKIIDMKTEPKPEPEIVNTQANTEKSNDLPSIDFED